MSSNFVLVQLQGVPRLGDTFSDTRLIKFAPADVTRIAAFVTALQALQVDTTLASSSHHSVVHPSCTVGRELLDFFFNAVGYHILNWPLVISALGMHEVLSRTMAAFKEDVTRLWRPLIDLLDESDTWEQLYRRADSDQWTTFGRRDTTVNDVIYISAPLAFVQVTYRLNPDNTPSLVFGSDPLSYVRAYKPVAREQAKRERDSSGAIDEESGEPESKRSRLEST